MAERTVAPADISPSSEWTLDPESFHEFAVRWHPGKKQANAQTIRVIFDNLMKKHADHHHPAMVTELFDADDYFCRLYTAPKRASDCPVLLRKSAAAAAAAAAESKPATSVTNPLVQSLLPNALLMGNVPAAPFPTVQYPPPLSTLRPNRTELKEYYVNNTSTAGSMPSSVVATNTSNTSKAPESISRRFLNCIEDNDKDTMRKLLAEKSSLAWEVLDEDTGNSALHLCVIKDRMDLAGILIDFQPKRLLQLVNKSNLRPHEVGDSQSATRHRVTQFAQKLAELTADELVKEEEEEKKKKEKKKKKKTPKAEASNEPDTPASLAIAVPVNQKTKDSTSDLIHSLQMDLKAALAQAARLSVGGGPKRVFPELAAAPTPTPVPTNSPAVLSTATPPPLPQAQAAAASPVKSNELSSKARKEEAAKAIKREKEKERERAREKANMKSKEAAKKENNKDAAKPDSNAQDNGKAAVTAAVTAAAAAIVEPSPPPQSTASTTTTTTTMSPPLESIPAAAVTVPKGSKESKKEASKAKQSGSNKQSSGKSANQAKEVAVNKEAPKGVDKPEEPVASPTEISSNAPAVEVSKDSNGKKKNGKGAPVASASASVPAPAASSASLAPMTVGPLASEHSDSWIEVGKMAKSKKKKDGAAAVSASTVGVSVSVDSATNISEKPVDREKLRTLLEMGFDSVVATNALHRTRGNVEDAIQLCCESTPSPSPVQPLTGPSHMNLPVTAPAAKQSAATTNQRHPTAQMTPSSHSTSTRSADQPLQQQHQQSPAQPSLPTQPALLPITTSRLRPDIPAFQPPQNLQFDRNTGNEEDSEVVSSFYSMTAPTPASPSLAYAPPSFGLPSTTFPPSFNPTFPQYSQAAPGTGMDQFYDPARVSATVPPPVFRSVIPASPIHKGDPANSPFAFPPSMGFPAATATTAGAWPSQVESESTHPYYASGLPFTSSSFSANAGVSNHLNDAGQRVFSRVVPGLAPSEDASRHYAGPKFVPGSFVSNTGRASDDYYRPMNLPPPTSDFQGSSFQPANADYGMLNESVQQQHQLHSQHQRQTQHLQLPQHNQIQQPFSGLGGAGDAAYVPFGTSDFRGIEDDQHGDAHADDLELNYLVDQYTEQDPVGFNGFSFGTYHPADNEDANGDGRHVSNLSAYAQHAFESSVDPYASSSAEQAFAANLSSGSSFPASSHRGFGSVLFPTSSLHDMPIGISALLPTDDERAVSEVAFGGDQALLAFVRQMNADQRRNMEQLCNLGYSAERVVRALRLYPDLKSALDALSSGTLQDESDPTSPLDQNEETKQYMDDGNEDEGFFDNADDSTSLFGKHNNFNKGRLCFQFSRTGRCNHESSCKFVHADGSKLPTPPGFGSNISTGASNLPPRLRRGQNK